MPVPVKNPQIAVKHLTELVIAAGVLECSAGDVSDQMVYIANLPEANGRFEVTWNAGKASIRLANPIKGNDNSFIN